MTGNEVEWKAIRKKNYPKKTTEFFSSFFGDGAATLRKWSGAVASRSFHTHKGLFKHSNNAYFRIILSQSCLPQPYFYTTEILLATE